MDDVTSTFEVQTEVVGGADASTLNPYAMEKIGLCGCSLSH